MNSLFETMSYNRSQLENASGGLRWAWIRSFSVRATLLALWMRLRIWRGNPSEFESRLSHKSRHTNRLAVFGGRRKLARRNRDVVQSVVVAADSEEPPSYPGRWLPPTRQLNERELAWLGNYMIEQQEAGL